MTKNQNKVVKSSLSKRNFQKFCQNKLAVIGVIGLTIMVLACIFAPFITPYDPSDIPSDAMEIAQNKNLPMSWEHPFGTDRLARDIFARILYGGRWSIFIGVATALMVNLVGVILGAIAGYFGGKIDSILVSIQEFFSVFPGILLLLLAISLLGQGVSTMMITWTLTGWGSTMRMVRAKVMSLKQEPFVESCRANGISEWSIMFRHMIPNTMGPILIAMVSSVATYMIAEAGMSYLGLGVPETTPTWGNIINAAKNLSTVQTTPQLWLVPGATMCLFITFVNSVGNGLRDALDPTSK